jgi:hypothetical protein
MSVFHHPHLTRGIVNTPKGSFVIVRGLVEVPDEIGESLGWRPVDVEANPQAAPASPRAVELTPAPSDAPSWSRALKKTEREARARMIRAKAATLRSRLHIQPNE